MEQIVTPIVFGPQSSALIAGLFGRRIGNVPSQAVTTGFRLAVLSWYVFPAMVRRPWSPSRSRSPLHPCGRLHFNWSIHIDTQRDHAGGGEFRLVPRAPLFMGYMAGTTPNRASSLSVALHLRHARPRDGGGLHAQLFFGWEGVGPASYLLIGFWFQKPQRQRRLDQGFRGQPGGRFRFSRSAS